MSRVLTSGLRRAVMRPTTRRVRRNFGGHGSEEEIKSGMEYWKKATYVGVPFVGVALLANFVWEMQGHHAHEAPKYSYLKIRNKPYPWGKGDCNFFDLKCRGRE
mmetsp:Transcript_5773/g.14013  ORF Transcript_5773/g.14013 Transcript_5773/m.14013 type:complete len:104 (-) Transcript_5773:281-592(-)|eukprot:CAMPEP_0114499572 /NCGR_PEP_ID=MMETSP0109-20121206/7492_1 /TAXON_ID=29199 /ORGANISM="Chlorarachnion reptans, Strain CCCM449" /LENGTH=103 /DNA_ID=CAMNT_0001677155 /DNA_START=23 /DNA_END=334 /DNA_ORIENTATION=-